MPDFTWQTISTGVEGPGPRSRHGLIHDREAGSTILFGGIVWKWGGRLRSDTWELKDGLWKKIHLIRRPRARHRGAMVFDAQRGMGVLFGGQASDGSLLADTWIYRGRRWHPRRNWPWKRPRSRCGHSLAYDEETRRVVLFGGVGNFDRSLDDTWVFDGSSWQRMDGPHPFARRYAAFAYDPDLRGCVLHGGSLDDRGVQQFGDAWLFRGQRWARLPSGFETDPRDDHGLGYHWASRSMVMLDSLRSSRGLLVGTSEGWRSAHCEPLHPRHQCSPLAWDTMLNGLVLHGGEVRHGGPQYGETYVLRLAQT